MRYFISGHTDLTEEEFDIYYRPQIDEALKESQTSFVIGDAKGADLKANKYLKSKGFKDVTIYHIGEVPYNGNPGNYPTRGGFNNHNEKDSTMTLDSDQDILYIRSIEEQKKIYGDKYRHRISGTEKNKIRRANLQKI